MAETLGMKSIGVGARMTGQTLGLMGDNEVMSQGGMGYTPSIMSPIKHGTGIGLGIGDNTLYSHGMPSPMGLQRKNSVMGHDPMRAVDD